MGTKIKSNALAVELSSVLHGYSVKVTQAVSDAVVQAGNVALKEVKKKSPKRTGKYAKSWEKKKESTGIGKRNTKVIIHNKDLYRLPHLLENGYQKANGGRVEGIPHIAPAVEAAEKSLDAALPKAIEEAADDL